MKFFSSFPATYINNGGLHFYFFTVLKGIGDAQSFLATFCRANSCSFRTRFFSASRSHSSQEGLWWTEGCCSGVGIIDTVPAV